MKNYQVSSSDGQKRTAPKISGSILRHSGIRRATNEAAQNKVQTNTGLTERKNRDKEIFIALP
jgi:hypothetical protein